MKNLFKKIIAALSSKTNELRIRVMIFFLLHKKSIDKTNCITHSLSHKLHTLVAPRHHRHPPEKTEHILQDQDKDESGSRTESAGTHLLMSYNCGGPYIKNNLVKYKEKEKKEEEKEEKREKYPDLTHELFMETEAALEAGGEEDIDQKADMFIERFKRQIQLQKQQYSLDMDSSPQPQIRLLKSN